MADTVSGSQAGPIRGLSGCSRQGPARASAVARHTPPGASCGEVYSHHLPGAAPPEGLAGTIDGKIHSPVGS